MADTRATDQMDHILIDKNPLALLQLHGAVQGAYFNCPFEKVNELQILMPVHDLKTGIPGIAAVVDYLQHQIWKIGFSIEVYGVDIIFVRS